MPELNISGYYTSRKFESNSPDIAKIDESTGEVTGVKKGSTDVTVSITDNVGNEMSASCTINVEWGTLEVGTEVMVKDKSFYVMSDSGESVKLLSKTAWGNLRYDAARSQAASYGSSLGGTGRLMTLAELQSLPRKAWQSANIYWLNDWHSNNGIDNRYWVAQGNIWSEYDNGVNLRSVRPVVVISKDKLTWQ